MGNLIYKTIKKWLGVTDTVVGEWMDFFVFLLLVVLLIYILVKMRSVQMHNIRVLIVFMLFISICGLLIKGIFIFKFMGYGIVTSSGIRIDELLIDVLLLLVTISVLVYSIWYLRSCEYREVPGQNKRFAIYGMIVGTFTSAAGVVALIRDLGVM